MDTEIVFEFGTGGNGTELTKTGWSNPEPEFRWMVGFESIVMLPTPVSAARYQLSLDVRPHIRPHRLPKQALIIAVNDMIVSASEITHDTTITCEVPRLAVELANQLTVRLFHPNGESPRSLSDIDDERVLAVALERVVLRWFGVFTAGGIQANDAADANIRRVELSGQVGTH
jgi:hypothetical protein